MAELPSKKTDKEFVPANSQLSVQPKARVRSSFFTYYIHDSTDACRLQLLGELTVSDVPELSGCWRTAKTTLGNRKLILDLQRLVAFDEEGKQWLSAMASEGAACLPDTYLRDGLAGQPPAAQPGKLGFFGKLFSIFRGSRVLPAESSTQAP